MGISEENVKLTKHALEQMQERGITNNEVLRVLQRGSRVQQTEGTLAIHGGIGVAYQKTKKGQYRVKTVIWI
ncbi:MAG: DUF4258 domain-containing protein [Nanoarchaeota archaeon]